VAAQAVAAPPWCWSPGRAPADVARAVSAWCGGPALARLASPFDAAAAGATTPEDRLARLEAVAARHWDLRGGRERHHLDAGPGHLDDLVLAAGAELGLLGERPPLRDRYDWVLVLGGLLRACLVRPRHLALLHGQGLRAGQVVGLGAFRPLSGSELPMVAPFGLAVADEFGCLVEGMHRALRPRGPGSTERGADDDVRRRWRVDRWALADRTPVAAVAAPSGDPLRRRANTADGYAFWLERFHPAAGETVLVITNPIYVPYQGAVAARLLGLGHGLAVETIGAGAAAGDLGGRTPGFSPRHYLQEIAASVTAMRALRDAAQQSGMVWSQSWAALSP